MTIIEGSKPQKDIHLDRMSNLNLIEFKQNFLGELTDPNERRHGNVYLIAKIGKAHLENAIKVVILIEYVLEQGGRVIHK